MKNLDVVVDTGTNSDHYLVTAVVDTAGLHSTSAPLVKKIVRNLKQNDFELLRYDLEQSGIVQLVLQCQNLNNSIAVYHDILSKIIEKHALLFKNISKHLKRHGGIRNVKMLEDAEEFLKEHLGRINL